MSGLGSALLIVLGAVLLIGGAKGSLLRAGHQIATPIPDKPLAIKGSSSPGPGAPGSGVTTD